MKILTIVGARPQFIKAAPLSIELQKHNFITEHILHSGQHYDRNMSEIFFNQLKIPRPFETLDMPFSTQGELTANTIKATEQAIININPDFVIVFGDTNTTLGAAIAASKLETRLCHIEAGLRSFDMHMPEEINRRLVDHCSDILFAPSETAVRNLKQENITHGLIFTVGDIMYDAIKLWQGAAIRPANFPHPENDEKIIFTTLHRRENLLNRNRLREFTNAILELAKSNIVVFPIHPHTRKLFSEHGLLDKLVDPNILIYDPLSYLESLYILMKADLLITDSGGMQKEAFYCRLHCITYRKQTEWPETITAGANCLVNSTQELLNAAARCLIRSDRPTINSTPYGDGTAAAKITEILIKQHQSQQT